ncbi:unnamed protein product, partial [Rotaria sp. Silwood2]
IHVQELIENYGVSIDQIGVITPYNMQVQLLRQKLLNKYPTLEIKSVDGFQGREKEAIIISMITRMLTIQYRMNEAIMNWSSNEFYQGKLIADESVKSHLLKDLSNISKRDNIYELDDENLSQCPLFLIDTTGYDMPEICCDDENSRGNEGEVALVSIHVQELIENYGVSIDQIGVITPYNMQVQLLRQKLLNKYPTLE